jgi:hypothetical protein
MHGLLRFWRARSDLPAVLAARKLYRAANASNCPEARGRRLLRMWLSPRQLTQFDERGFFEVVGCHTGTRYRIYYGKVANVGELDSKGQLLIHHCFIPKGGLVAGDVMVAQKIALETDEWAALAVSNRFTPVPRYSA